jgi:hypothetical protein
MLLQMTITINSQVIQTNKYKMRLFINILFITLFFLGCQETQESNSTTVESNCDSVHESTLQVGDTVVYTTRVYAEGCYVLVCTTKCFSRSDLDAIANHDTAVVEQHLNFLKDGTSLNQRTFRPSSTSTCDGNIISEIAYVKGNAGGAYRVYATNGSGNGAAEYLGYFSVEGISVYESFRCLGEDSFLGSYDTLLKRYQIVDTSNVSPMIEGVMVYPSRLAGDKTKVHIR